MVSWRAVLLAILTLFVVDLLLAIVFDVVGVSRNAATIVALVASMAVAYRVAPQRKWLNAVLAVAAYYALSFGIVVILSLLA